MMASKETTNVSLRPWGESVGSGTPVRPTGLIEENSHENDAVVFTDGSVKRGEKSG